MNDLKEKEYEPETKKIKWRSPEESDNDQSIDDKVDDEMIMEEKGEL